MEEKSNGRAAVNNKS